MRMTQPEQPTRLFTTQRLSAVLRTILLLCCFGAIIGWGTFSPSYADQSPLGPPDFETLFWDTLPWFSIAPERVPEHFRDQVQKLLYDYTVTHRKLVQDMLRRCALYITSIKRVLRQHGLPLYYAYIPLAESAFRTDAEHPVSGARGLWQLMPETARIYGLQVTDELDERVDPLRATQAAARYLQELHDMFGRGAPLLILSAYNYGESNIYKAIVRARTRDIWELMRKWQIPEETRGYLVKIVTLWILVTHASMFQFDMGPDLTAVLPYSEISFRQPGVPGQQTVRLLLPEPHPSTLPPPHTCAPDPAYTLASIISPIHVHLACWYTVRPGDTLSEIAVQHQISLSMLKRLNQLQGKNPTIFPGQHLAICQVPFSRMASKPALALH